MFTQARKIQEIFKAWNDAEKVSALAALGFTKSDSALPQEGGRRRRRGAGAEAKLSVDVSGENLDFILAYKETLPLRVFTNLIVSVLEQIYNQSLSAHLKMRELCPEFTEAERIYAERIKENHALLKPMLDVAAPEHKGEGTIQRGLRHYPHANLLEIPRVQASTIVYSSHSTMRDIFRGLLEKYKIPVEQGAGSYHVYIISGLDDPAMKAKLQAMSIEFFQIHNIREINGAIEALTKEIDTNPLAGALFDKIKQDGNQATALFSHICSFLPLKIDVDISGNTNVSTSLAQSAVLLFSKSMDTIIAKFSGLPPEYQLMAVADMANALSVPKDRYKLALEKKTYTQTMEERFEVERWL